MRSGYYIGRLLGLNVSISWIWPPTVLLWACNLSILPEPGWDPATARGMGITGSVLVLVCMLLHALTHVLLARLKASRSAT